MQFPYTNSKSFFKLREKLLFKGFFDFIFNLMISIDRNCDSVINVSIPKCCHFYKNSLIELEDEFCKHIYIYFGCHDKRKFIILHLFK